MLVIREAAIVVVGYLCRQRQAVKAQSWHFLDVLNVAVVALDCQPPPSRRSQSVSKSQCQGDVGAWSFAASVSLA